MQLHDIKQVSIVDYLAQTGFEAKLIKGVNYWYCSPLRSELTPSFKVNAERNQWYDFGTGDHGDIIDLVCTLQHCSTAEAMRSLSRLKGTRSAESFSFGGTTPVSLQRSSMELISVQADSIVLYSLTLLPKLISLFHPMLCSRAFLTRTRRLDQATKLRPNYL